MARFAVLPLLALTACAAPEPKTFDIGALRPTVEADQKTLTGWFQIGERFREFRLYPTKSDLGRLGKGACVSGVMLSLAGIPTADFNDQLMTVTGSIHGAGSTEAGVVNDECRSGIVLLAMDVSVAE